MQTDSLLTPWKQVVCFSEFYRSVFLFFNKKMPVWLEKARILYILSPEFAIAPFGFRFPLLPLRAGNPAIADLTPSGLSNPCFWRMAYRENPIE
jgi:hypothetical protein